MPGRSFSVGAHVTVEHQLEKTMKRILLICLLFVSSASFSSASSNFDQEVENKKYYEHEKRHDDLMVLINQIRYDANRLARQEELIGELRMEIKDLEHNIFQANQSLRNLELEVWDLKDSMKDLSRDQVNHKEDLAPKK